MCRTLCESNDWLQIDLGKTIEVCGVATQGNGHINGGGYREWTINFKLPYSVSPDGSGLTTYRDTQSAETVRIELIGSMSIVCFSKRKLVLIDSLETLRNIIYIVNVLKFKVYIKCERSLDISSV